MEIPFKCPSNYHPLLDMRQTELADFGLQPGEGIYADMNAIRPDEDLDNQHSIYVDRWDWERVMHRSLMILL